VAVPTSVPQGLIFPEVEALIRASGADLRLGGEKAFYAPGPRLHPAACEPASNSGSDSILPNAGHNINLEDPAAFNAHLAELFAAADAGTWPVRDPRAMVGSILGK
jgi:pimeloyl-ACP methyl ester carboxylesterase